MRFDMNKAATQYVPINEIDIRLKMPPEFPFEELRELIASQFAIEVVDQKEIGVERWLLDKRK